MKPRRSGRLSSPGDAFIPLIDIIAGLAGFGILLALLQVLFINEPPKDVAEKRTPTEPSPFYLELKWEDGAPHDVDTWVRCTVARPDGNSESYTVSYLQKHAGPLDLVWDDLGGPTPQNFERVISNSLIERIPPNTFCYVNAHLYNSHSGAFPLRGHLTLILDKDGSSEEVLTPAGGLKFILSFPGEETTLFRIGWDQHGQPMRESIEAYPNVQRICLATKACLKR
jgi:hypothetical protein